MTDPVLTSEQEAEADKFFADLEKEADGEKRKFS